MDYRRWFDDSGMLYSYDLEEHNGRDAVLQIEKAWGGEVTGEKGRKSKKPIVKFVGLEKTLALNKTNGKTIARLYGKDGSKWAGCWVALYVTTVDYDGEVRDCIRVRPQKPDVQRPVQNGKRPKQEVDIGSMITAYEGCDEMEMFEALESDRKIAWGAIVKDDKTRLRSASEAAHRRILDAAHAEAETANRVGPDNAAEIATQEAQS